ncbi:MAG: GNAT family N-acetyltransferase [Defluviitaleaceae bacterium]|nr:GNAT family N-acetyltransferase [Defluviitaleaceae bacterium]
MSTPDYIIRPINPSEISKIADLLSTGYYHDKFFKWSVDCDASRHKIVADYYKVYLSAVGCVSHVAVAPCGEIVGATVWLPHDTDAGIYDEIDKVVGEYAPQFRAVCDRSHDSEPPMAPFYQLVGFVVTGAVQGRGVGGALLKYHLDILDKKGIPTYLEASTPYFGGGVYGRFGYQQVGELMVFADTAVLYPLWRPAGGAREISVGYKDVSCVCKESRSLGFSEKEMAGCLNNPVDFGGYKWRVLDKEDGKLLLLSEKVLFLHEYNAVFRDITWADSTAREYLNTAFLNGFTPEEQLQMADIYVCNHGNPWYRVMGGLYTVDKVFLLSVEEVIKYLGSSGQVANPQCKYFVDDDFNDARRAVFTDGSPCRWALRTPGNMANFVAAVTLDGRIAMTGDFVNRPSTALFNVGLRPAVWVAVS